MAPDRKVRRTTSQRQAVRRSAQAVSRVPVAPAGPNWWKRLTLAGAAIVAVAAIGFGANQVVNGGALTGGNGAASVAPSQQAPSVDESKVRALMQELQADPNNIDTLMALGDEYYFGTQYAVAGTWFTKILAIDANNVKALNAEGAVLYNTKDLAGAEATWKKTIAVDPSNVEAHFNLGFLYMNSQTPDFAGVQREWNEVIRLDPAGQFAQVAKAHLDSLVKASMIPAASGAPTGSGAPAGSPAASTSPAASAAPVASGSPAASASPAASTQP
jgi:cytochrome c-type biogenesis protein CcmH/NrfG